MKTKNPENLLSYTQSELLRKLGFNEHCDWRYDEQNKNKLINWKDEAVNTFFKDIENNGAYTEHYSKYLSSNYYDTFDNDDKGFYIAAPSYDQAFKFFRDNYNIHGEIKLLAGSNIHGLRTLGKEKVFHWVIQDLNNKRWSDGETISEEYFSYEAGEIDCLTEIIKFVIERNSFDWFQKSFDLYLLEERAEYDRLCNSGSLVNYRELDYGKFIDAGINPNSKLKSFFAHKFIYYFNKSNNG